MRAIDRRASARRTPSAGEPLSRVRLRTGRELLVVDVSGHGVLVDGTARLLPGTHLDVHVVTPDGRVLVRSRVVRSRVSHLEADAIRYRSALAFAHPVDTAESRVVPCLVPQVDITASGESASTGQA